MLLSSLHCDHIGKIRSGETGFGFY